MATQSGCHLWRSHSPAESATTSPHVPSGKGQAGLEIKSTSRLQLGCIQKRLKKALYLIIMQVTSHAGIVKNIINKPRNETVHAGIFD